MSKQPDRSGGKAIQLFNWQTDGHSSSADLAASNLPPVVQSVEPSSSSVSANLKLTQPPRPSKPAPRRSRRRSPHRPPYLWGWSLLWLSAFCIVGSMGTGAFLWLTNLPPSPNCQKISPLSADMERLYCAREAVQSGSVDDVIAGLNVVKDWSPDQPLYSEAQELLEDWSAVLLLTARTTIEQDGLDQAVDMVRHIPPHSPIYAEAQETIAQWQQEWQKGDTIYAAAQTAIKNQNWNAAARQVPALGRLENNYWRRYKASDLTQQILVEREAWQTLTQANQLAKGGDPNKMGEAIALIQQVDPHTYVAPEATANLKRWSQSLLNLGIARWRQGDLQGAVALARQIPPDLEVDLQGQDLVKFSHAEQLVGQTSGQIKPSLNQIWNLLEAVAAVRQIQPGSPLYSLAQAKMQNWEQQVQDLTQLQYAHAIANLGQRSTFELAIDQAQLVATDRPKWIQAQTLIAYWHQQIERIEDQPYLIHARDLAKPGTILALRDAIAIARQVPLGRALRIDAQTAIAQWTRQIETIEDRPFMDQAQTLAQQGKLHEAIRAAAKIRSGRALYDQAQTLIGNWRGQIRAAQIAQDRRILNEAASLAAATKLTPAIETAAQIGSDRPLYGEARAAIAQWEAERADIWAAWDEEETDDYSTDDYATDDGYYYD